MAKCLVCNSDTHEFISFGRMPIANGFLTVEQFSDEYFINLKVGFCQNCLMVQLTELVKRERMFNENYAFFSSTSSRMAQHFQEFAETVQKKYLIGQNPFVVEIGSNDGIMLRHFANKDIHHLGIEPSENVAETARQKGVQTISEFFDEALARKIITQHGQVDAFLGANVMCHIPYIHSVAAGIKQLLKPQGVLIFEDPYLGDIIEKTSYDQIYDEHAFYFSAHSIRHLFAQHDMYLIDVEPQNVHGGSMRYTLAHKGAYSIQPAVNQLLAKENDLGLASLDTYNHFRENVERSRDDLMHLLRYIKNQGKRIVAYAATSKSTTVTNYCGITPDLVDFISDTTPIKQGKFSPGTHIPVCPYEAFQANYPEYALLFGWNHMEEIMAKEQAFKTAGGKWIVYVPTVQVIE